MFPLYLLSQGVLKLWMNVEFYQIILLNLLRWSRGFYLFFCWCDILCWLICVCWTILMMLGWIQLHRDVRYFLMCYWNLFANIFLRMFGSTFIRYWSLTFFIWFWYQNNGALQNDFGSVPSSSVFWEFEKDQYKWYH